MLAKKTLRKEFIQHRQALSTTTKLQESQSLVKQLLNTSCYKQAKHIAIYLATQQEINLEPVIQACWLDKKKTYLPSVNSTHLNFYAYDENTHLINNKFQIFEPKHNPNTIIAPTELDLVLMPLVAIDRNGNRLGMGKGFYDKTFAFLNTTPRPKKPLLVGVGFQCQYTDHLPNNELDVPCNAVLTHEQFYRCIQ